MRNRRIISVCTRFFRCLGDDRVRGDCFGHLRRAGQHQARNKSERAVEAHGICGRPTGNIAKNKSEARGAVQCAVGPPQPADYQRSDVFSQSGAEDVSRTYRTRQRSRIGHEVEGAHQAMQRGRLRDVGSVYVYSTVETSDEHCGANGDQRASRKPPARPTKTLLNDLAGGHH